MKTSSAPIGCSLGVGTRSVFNRSTGARGYFMHSPQEVTFSLILSSDYHICPCLSCATQGCDHISLRSLPSIVPIGKGMEYALEVLNSLFDCVWPCLVMMCLLSPNR